MYKKLFEPIVINDLSVRNRIAMPAFGLKYCLLDRMPTDRLIEFYEARAAGGCGLIVVGGVGVDMVGSGLMMPGIDTDAAIPHWERLAKAIKRHDARLFLQLFHAGRYQHARLAKGEQAVAPSAVLSRYTGETPRALEIGEIHEVQERFAAAAERARKAGADGVEIIASAGYLVCQFLSPLTNRRTDEYGGSFENRCRFGVETIRRVRERVGDDYPIGIRVSGNEFMPGGNGSADIVRACREFENAGVDVISVTGGWHETRVPQLPSMVPRSAFSYLAAGIRREVEVPVIASNRIVDPGQAEALLNELIADMVNIGRAQIADPEWARKAQAGCKSSIRPCVGCLQGCMDRLFGMRAVECLCNPQAGYEGLRIVTPAEISRVVAVVGAGPAGLEAALVASRRGHVVHLFEASGDIGGQLPYVAAPPGREEFASLLDYYRTSLEASKVTVHLRTCATVETLKKLGPGHVILASGSTQLKPPIPGIDGQNVVMAWDALTGRADIGRTVAVIGGGAVGVETAITIADRGTVDGETLKFLLKHDAEDFETLRRLTTRGTRTVTLLEQLPKLGKDIGKTSRWVFLKELDLLGVDILIGARVTEIREDGVVCEVGSETRFLPVDTVVVALGAVSNQHLKDDLEQAGFPVSVIGDAKQPRKLVEAIHEGFLTALEI